MSTDPKPTGTHMDRDSLFQQAVEVCIQHQLGSTSLLQRKLKIGYGRAARLIDQLHKAGVLGPPDGSKPREVLMSATDALTRGLTPTEATKIETGTRTESVPAPDAQQVRTIRVVFPQLDALFWGIVGLGIVYLVVGLWPEIRAALARLFH